MNFKTRLSELEIVACSGRREGPLGALCMDLNSGHTATVCVNVLSAVTLVATLKAMFPGSDTPPTSPAIVTQSKMELEYRRDTKAVDAGYSAARGKAT
jgi:hypothetical protein